MSVSAGQEGAVQVSSEGGEGEGGLVQGHGVFVSAAS